MEALIPITFFRNIFPLDALLLFKARVKEIILNLNNVFQKYPSRGVLIARCSEICTKFTGEHPCRSVISINLLKNFIEATLLKSHFDIGVIM